MNNINKESNSLRQAMNTMGNTANVVSSSLKSIGTKVKDLGMFSTNVETDTAKPSEKTRKPTLFTVDSDVLKTPVAAAISTQTTQDKIQASSQLPDEGQEKLAAQAEKVALKKLRISPQLKNELYNCNNLITMYEIELKDNILQILSSNELDPWHVSVPENVDIEQIEDAVVNAKELIEEKEQVLFVDPENLVKNYLKDILPAYHTNIPGFKEKLESKDINYIGILEKGNLTEMEKLLKVIDKIHDDHIKNFY